ncbi:hypothetical protein Q4Q54_17670 [Shewanella sp. SP2S2-4]|uniref:DUF5329 domain-containing protein n=1 Tax=Shewanella septentrionalis TaxID=2952223 RepID=A0A9X3AW77_9GAMM|nr:MULTISPECIES: hypothetical protein [Shewanella]MCT7947986.1 hypothetical protein [Shewanella septentrionalis]MDT3275294.1 hypothetical protein [Shewanella sp. SP2S2-4]MDT3337309.1 hypothetical protein [Shewanella sp. SP1S1-7]
MNKIVRSGFLILIVFTSWVAVADSPNSHEYKLGAFTGAMKYCEEKYEDDGRYKWARLRAADEFRKMSSSEKLSYALGRDNANRKGQYLGDKLDKNECRSLLKLSEWKRFSKK